jgi:hypothetical protein
VSHNSQFSDERKSLPRQDFSRRGRSGDIQHHMRKSNPDLEKSEPLIFEDGSSDKGYKDDSYLLRHQVYFNRDDLLEQKMVEE